MVILEIVLTVKKLNGFHGLLHPLFLSELELADSSSNWEAKPMNQKVSMSKTALHTFCRL